MKQLFSKNALLLYVIALLVVVRSEVGVVAQDDETAKLISGLGDASFAKRKEAEKKLLELGEAALPELTQAKTSNDSLEIRVRAARLIKGVIANSLESKSLNMKFAWLKSGKFQMGSVETEASRREDERRHDVEITNPFMIAAKEVTQAEYNKVMDASPSWFSAAGQGKSKVKGATENFPVDSVSWYDALLFCNRLSKREHFPLFYELTEVRKERGSIVAAKVKVNGGIGYRLPTEAEWEYACRAGTNTAYNLGKTSRQGNFQYRRDSYGGAINVALGRTTSVGSYKPNAWGLYDMHGNVAEWCWDRYDKKYYFDSPTTDPQGPSASHYRVLRGGSFLVNKTRCRSASRFWSFPGEGKFYIGFRVARTPSKMFIDAFNANR